MTVLTAAELIDLKTEINEVDIWNDVRVMLPSYGYTYELVGQQWFKYPINLQARATDGQSINRYGRRTKTMNKHVIYKEYAEAYCEGVLATCKEPIQKINAKMIGSDNSNTVKALTLKAGQQIDYLYAPAGLSAWATIDNLTLDIDSDGIPRLELNLTDTAPLINPPEPPIPERQFLHIDEDTVDDTTDLIG